MRTKFNSQSKSRFSGARFKRGGFGSGGKRSGGRSRPAHQRTRNFTKGEYINPSLFINKAVITDIEESFTPENTFQSFAIHPRLKEEIVKKGYESPTPIQDKVIPQVLLGRDVVGIANTGTGKTAAFLIPLIHKVATNRSEKVLVVAPTRELALQINEELRSFTAGAQIYSVCCVGGANIRPQITKLRMENQFIIGTPGRLKDLIERKLIRLSEFKTIVLDEADRMLDMGFVNDMRFLMAGMPRDRHTLFFSATLSPAIEKLIVEFLNDPVRVSVKTRDTSKNVEQDVVRVEKHLNKLELLETLLSQKEFSKVLIFGRTKHGVEKLSKILTQKGFPAESIHGNKNHSKRQRALGAFKINQIQILVATDVAARGLDIPDVTHVINFDLPATYDDYVHRIGRTGRGEKKGKALTFIE